MRWLEQPQQHVLMWDQADYPALLAQIPDPPPLLFVAGDPLILEKPQLAMVGSRRASRPGMDTAAAFSRSLAGAGFVITSGLALGIDAAAHQAALDVGGQTVGVLGTGLEKFYPQRNRRLADAMIASGSAVLSEFPWMPARRRAISPTQPDHQRSVPWRAGGRGQCRQRFADHRATGGGTGSRGLCDSWLDSPPGARGCHQLIRDGAVLVETIEHILEALRGWQQLPLSTEMPEAGHPLLTLLHAAPHTSEALADSCGWTLPKVLAALTELEMDGRAVCENGRWLARTR